MPMWDKLGDNEREAVQSLANALRGAAVTMGSLTKQGQVISAAWNSGINGLVGSLDSDEVIPNASGLAGARDLTAAEIVVFVGYMVAISDPSNIKESAFNKSSDQALRVKLSGINAQVIG